ncbi:nucleotidyl transferase AbiEii/AbiGii toxin family protein [Polynucleobacter kasalickyi]|uniref:nucleotidyl transferase AbiEii/AbiGii toxin family protein n=1 Tax=Polynucleobacter kasalickyi TaxID=1938817 RepID=UPI001F46A8B1|nr:nucleotidyl transferase AbiEii/AbiGii toxin family protein [Polynucleobacter kasalickyi]
MLLHQHKNFKELIATVSNSMAIHPTLVEKDYWIMHSLWGLQQQGFNYELKGGTSLSKGFGLIHRFSEDIDIRIHPPEGVHVQVGKNQVKKTHIQSRFDFYEWIAKNIKILGVQEVVRDYAFDDQEKLRSGGVRLNYQTTTSSLNGLKEGILLELGFDDTAPNRPVDISSWAYDYAIRYLQNIEDNRAKKVLCYLPEYTFVEKLQTISTKYRHFKDGKGFPKNFLRHYYDVYCLLGHSPVLEFVKTEKYKRRKVERFPKSDNLIISQNPAFLLSDQKDRQLFESEYLKVASLYYKGQPNFNDLMNRIHFHLKVL